MYFKLYFVKVTPKWKSYGKCNKRMVFHVNLNIIFTEKLKLRQGHRNDQFISPSHGKLSSCQKMSVLAVTEFHLGLAFSFDPQFRRGGLVVINLFCPSLSLCFSEGELEGQLTEMTVTVAKSEKAKKLTMNHFFYRGNKSSKNI